MEEIENPYRWQAWSAFVTTLIGALGFAVFVIPHALPVANGLLTAAIVVSTTFLLVCGLPLLVFCLWLGHEGKKEVRDLLAGSHLVHWHYSLDEWRRFAGTVWARARRKALITPLIALCFFLVLGLFVTLVLSSLLLLGVLDAPLLHEVSMGRALLILAAENLVSMGMAGAILGVVFGVTEYLKARGLYLKALKSPGEAYIGPLGFYMQGRYVRFPWWSRLSPGGMESGDPTILRLNIEVPLPRRYRIFRHLRVPIPSGKEEEARELLGRLSVQPYVRTTPDKPWRPGNPAFLLFLLLNLEFVLFYVRLHYRISFVVESRTAYWLLAAFFSSALLWWRNWTRFLKRMAVLGGICFGLSGALLQFCASLQVNYLVGALIAIALFAQVASAAFLVLEIKAWRQPDDRH